MTYSLCHETLSVRRCGSGKQLAGFSHRITRHGSKQVPHHLNQAVVTLECPHCGTRMKETVERLCVRVELACEACHANVSLDRAELHRVVALVATASRALEGRVMDTRTGVTSVMTTH